MRDSWATQFLLVLTDVVTVVGCRLKKGLGGLFVRGGGGGGGGGAVGGGVWGGGRRVRRNCGLKSLVYGGGGGGGGAVGGGVCGGGRRVRRNCGLKSLVYGVQLHEYLVNKQAYISKMCLHVCGVWVQVARTL
ncbi:unnamed protein product [Strongylus vulgaris]|uniref:Secreted protein n=1 Tax=Strongylus vulgaris TaxID=40348 RepID=A0A3P7LHU7_STRVU|nr:unnamed protein product [Strongylus vulgaris]